MVIPGFRGAGRAGKNGLDQACRSGVTAQDHGLNV